jgi:hypothetical protein
MEWETRREEGGKKGRREKGTEGRRKQVRKEECREE